MNAGGTNRFGDRSAFSGRRSRQWLMFAAAPLGLAFLIGQLLNTFGTVHTYEHVGDDGTGHYEPAVTLHPSS